MSKNIERTSTLLHIDIVIEFLTNANQNELKCLVCDELEHTETHRHTQMYTIVQCRTHIFKPQ